MVFWLVLIYIFLYFFAMKQKLSFYTWTPWKAFTVSTASLQGDQCWFTKAGEVPKVLTRVVLASKIKQLVPFRGFMVDSIFVFVFVFFWLWLWDELFLFPPDFLPTSLIFKELGVLVSKVLLSFVWQFSGFSSVESLLLRLLCLLQLLWHVISLPCFSMLC